MKLGWIALIGGGLCALLMFFWDITENQSSVDHSAPRKESSKNVKSILALDNNSSPIKPKPNCAENKPLFSGNNSNDLDTVALSKQLEQAFFDPQPFIDRSDTDPTANIVLFQLASNCPVSNTIRGRAFANNGCPKNIGKIPVKTTHLELLEKAALQGSDQAKLMYALNAPLVAQRFSRLNTQEGNLISLEILKKATLYGSEAARAGIPDAYRVMSRAYENGSFGQKDIRLAYAFALPLTKVGDTMDLEYIKSIGERLNEDMKHEARFVAFGCEMNTDLNSLASPF